MKNKFLAVLFCVVFAFCLASFVACTPVVVDYGTLTVADISVEVGKSAEIMPEFSNETYKETPVYTFEGNNISIANGIVEGLVGETETVVTAKTSHHEVTFKVTVTVDYGTLSIADVEISFGKQAVINPAFSKPEYEEDIQYAFEGENIAIENGMLTGIIPGTTTLVTATTAHHQTTFNVTVNYMKAELYSESGAEVKYGINTPDDNNYVLTGKVEVSKWRENGWTRLTAFAFNVSDNSWYNIELFGDGEVVLYARFNGVERYNIRLFNINDEGVIVDGKITYTIALVKTGEATKFYVNDKLVCTYLAEELAGYAKLGDIELTACANRENAGEFEVTVSDLYYQLEGSEAYARYAGNGETIMGFGNILLEAGDGGERKFVIANNSLPAEDFLFSTQVVVEKGHEAFMRSSSFAFNVSDNSWYNIEMGDDGTFILYGRFNGVEKYHIRLFNKNDEGIMVDGKIVYTVSLLKKGQNTYFFVNDKYVASFQADDLNGYAPLKGFEFTSATDAWWREGQAYAITYKDTKVLSATSERYAQMLEKATAPVTVADGNLVSDNGGERKYVVANSGMHATHSYSVVSMKVTVNAFDATAWFRSSALAFNASDNSWYNMELGGDGNVTLYARFNGVEKYHIHLFNLNDEGIIVDGKLTYTLTILRKGQASYFFVNDKLVCSFSKEELNGYPALDYLELTSCADRSGKPFDVTVSETKIESSLSETYAKYNALIG